MNYMSILIFSLLCLIAVLVYMTRQVLKEVLEELRLQGIHLKSLSEKFGGKGRKMPRSSRIERPSSGGWIR